MNSVNTPHIKAEELTMAYDDVVVQRDLNFEIARGEVFVVMGGSGCGKSTLLRHLVGLARPAFGNIFFDGADFWAASEEERQSVMRRSGVLYQGGALFSSMTVAENVAFPLEEYSGLTDDKIAEIVSFKLSLVGLSGFELYYPSQLSGGMRKRAALARAIALDPEILFFDEPSAGLDPVSASRLDDLILHLRDGLGATVVVVTHELASIFAIADTAIFLDVVTRTITAIGPPKKMLAESNDPEVVRFLTRDKKKVKQA